MSLQSPQNLKNNNKKGRPYGKMLFKKQIREIGRKDGRAEPLEVENGDMRVTAVKGVGGGGEGRYMSTAAAVDEEHGMA